MHGVAASHEYSRLSRTVQITHAYWAVIVSSFVLALMIAFSCFAHAAATVVAVIKIIFASNSANSAFFAVVDAFLLSQIVVQVANVTKVNCELLKAALTCFRFCLLKIATQAFDMGDSSSVELVVLLGIHFLFIANFIMAESTRPKLAWANSIGTLFQTCSSVMFATQITLLFIQLKGCIWMVWRFFTGLSTIFVFPFILFFFVCVVRIVLLHIFYLF